MSTRESAQNVDFKYATTVLHTHRMLTEIRRYVLKYRIFSPTLLFSTLSKIEVGDYIPVFYHSNHDAVPIPIHVRLLTPISQKLANATPNGYI
jgi:hypothetical protein